MIKRPLPTFQEMKFNPEQGLMISSDMHLTNTKATQEYDLGDVVHWCDHCGYENIIQILTGDTLDTMSVFFDVADAFWKRLSRVIVIIGNHDDQWQKLPDCHNYIASQWVRPCPEIGVRIHWGDRMIFATHGHDDIYDPQARVIEWFE